MTTIHIGKSLAVLLALITVVLILPDQTRQVDMLPHPALFLTMGG